eukprot:CAMPEP_0113905862 /NCGR_PEP_ID=MMETSP0780_2-20120614/24334_1 /TAXON_ID=652834 /ORGANISM="Palpitomonas bilix" /LENGTH=118 /DNA_ID=CAMNT_0000900211 /DNA_START=371 /DNA_END=724 /DNA_ORIENTATION=+ /assembly_acc=CAM_ASM_000599
MGAKAEAGREGPSLRDVVSPSSVEDHLGGSSAPLPSTGEQGGGEKEEREESATSKSVPAAHRGEGKAMPSMSEGEKSGGNDEKKRTRHQRAKALKSRSLLATAHEPPSKPSISSTLQG